MKRLLFSLSFIFLLNLGRGQDKTLDSLKTCLKKAKQDSGRMDILNTIAEFYGSVGNDDSALVYLLKAKIVSQRHFTDKSIFQAPYKKKYIAIIENLAGVYAMHGKKDSTSACIFLLKKFMEEAKDEKGLARVLNLMGINYFNMGDLASSSSSYYAAMKLREKIGDTKALSESYGNLTFINMATDNLEQALIYAGKAVQAAKASKDTAMILFTLGNLSATYSRLNNTDRALQTINEGLQIALKAGDSSAIAKSWSNVADYLHAGGKKDSALYLYKNALRIYAAYNDPLYFIDVSVRIGNIYYSMGKDKEAMLYVEKAYKDAVALNQPSQIAGPARLLSALYKRSGKYREALNMYEIYIRMNDSLTNAESKKASLKNEYRYEYEKRAAADSVKNAEGQKVKDAQLAAQTASLKQEKTQFWFLVCGLTFVVCGLLFVFNRFRITRKQKEIIEEQKIKVDEAFEKLHEKNKEVMDSIYYARRIQRALITNEKYVEKKLNGLNSGERK